MVPEGKLPASQPVSEQTNKKKPIKLKLSTADTQLSNKKTAIRKILYVMYDMDMNALERAEQNNLLTQTKPLEKTKNY